MIMRGEPGSCEYNYKPDWIVKVPLDNELVVNDGVTSEWSNKNKRKQLVKESYTTYVFDREVGEEKSNDKQNQTKDMGP